MVLTDPVRPRHAMDRLLTRFPHALLLDFQPEDAATARRPLLPRVDGRSDFDIALGFVEEVRAIKATTEEELLLQLACDSCRINVDPDADRRIEVSPDAGSPALHGRRVAG